MVLLNILRRWRLLAIWILRRRCARPLVGARQTVLLLVLRVLVGSHVRARLLRGRRREGGVHMRGRRGIGAVGRLLAGRGLPVGGHLALATLMRVHGEGR